MEAHAPIFQNKMHDTPLRAKTVVCYSEDRLTLQCGQHGFRALLCRTANKSNMALFGAFGIFQMPNQNRVLVDMLAADRKSTRSELQSLMRISYAVFCLKKSTCRRSQANTCAQHTIQHM